MIKTSLAQDIRTTARIALMESNDASVNMGGGVAPLFYGVVQAMKNRSEAKKLAKNGTSEVTVS